MQIAVLRKARGSGFFQVRIIAFDVPDAGLGFVFRFTAMPETFFYYGSQSSTQPSVVSAGIFRFSTSLLRLPSRGGGKSDPMANQFP
jgi:hypothetical protein